MLVGKKLLGFLAKSSTTHTLQSDGLYDFLDRTECIFRVDSTMGQLVVTLLVGLLS